MVEPHVANVIVASPSLVSRSFFWRRSQVVRQRSAKSPSIGSNPIAAFLSVPAAGMAELADARDLKSLGLYGCPGSIPGSGKLLMLLVGNTPFIRKYRKINIDRKLDKTVRVMYVSML